MSEFKACFCDGSCQKSGICGGDRDHNTFIGPDSVGYATDRRITKMTKAEEMAQISTKAIRDKEQKDKELVADFYQETLRLIEREAVKGNRLAEIHVPRHLSVDTVVQCLCEDGFGVINDSAYEIEITW